MHSESYLPVSTFFSKFSALIYYFMRALSWQILCWKNQKKVAHFTLQDELRPNEYTDLLFPIDFLI
jgi:hypothetical protein